MNFKRLHFYSVAITLLLFTSFYAYSTENIQTIKNDEPTKSYYSFYFGNDEFPIETDRYLTSVIRIALTEEEVPDFFQNLTPFYADEISYILEQNISTPDNMSDPDPTDRPYAGLLYLQVNIVSTVNDYGIVQVLGGRVGILGKYSLAEESQKLFHEIVGGKNPKDWDDQLTDELGADVIYTAVKSFRHDFSRFSIEFLPYASATIGTFFTNASAGGIVRYGINVPNDHGVRTITNGYNKDGKQKDQISAYVYAGLKGKYSYRDVFLDGNLFDDSQSVDKNDYIGEATTGLMVGYSNYRTNLSCSFTTEEFKKQDGPQFTLSLSFSVLF